VSPFVGVRVGRRRRIPFASGSTLLSGLVSWWDLDETSGARLDSVGSNDLTDVNTVLSAPGKIGNAADFVAANTEYLSLPDSDTFSPTGSFTASIWVLPTTTSTVYFFAKEESDPLSEWSILSGAAGAPEGRIWHTGGLVQCAAGPWVQWQWTMLTLVYDIDAGVATLYNDAAPGTPLAVSGTLYNRTGKLTIGGGARATYQDNTCDMAGFWDRALTQDEITELFNAGAGIKNDFTDNGEGLRQGLKAYWSMDEESGPRYSSAAIMSDALKVGLSHFYELDEPSGARLDSVGSLDLTDVNTVTQGGGKFGGSAHTTSGNNEKLDTGFPVPSYRSAAGETFSAWIKIPPGGSSQYVVAHGVTWYFRWTGSQWRAAIFQDGPSERSITATVSIDDGLWHHHLLRHDPGATQGESLEYWIDGVKAGGSASATGAITEAYLNTYGFVVGGYAASANKTQDVDLLGVWGRPITNAEIAELYNVGIGKHHGNSGWLTDNNTVGSTAGVNNLGAQCVAGNNEYLSHASPLTPDTSWTMAGWFWKETGAWAYVGHQGTGATIDWYLDLHNASGLRFILYDSVSGQSYPNIPPGSVPNDEWIHIVWGYDETTKKAWVSLNGAAPVLGAALPNGANQAGLFTNLGTAGVNARFDEVGLWERKLSTEEAAALYAAGAGRFYDFNSL
jgi:hypothetical protein